MPLSTEADRNSASVSWSSYLERQFSSSKELSPSPTCESIVQLEEGKSKDPNALPEESRRRIFFKVLDISTTTSSILASWEWYTEDGLDQFLRTIPPQEQHTIRVVLDGTSDNNYSEHSPEIPSCFDDRYISSECALYSLPNAPLNEGDVGYQIPALRNLIPGNSDKGYFSMQNFQYHSNRCMHWPKYESGLEQWVRYEKKTVLILASNDGSGQGSILVFRSPCAYKERRPETICANASWTFLRKLDTSLCSLLKLKCLQRTNTEGIIEMLLLEAVTVNLDGLMSYSRELVSQMTYDSKRLDGKISDLCGLPVLESGLVTLRRVRFAVEAGSYALSYLRRRIGLTAPKPVPKPLEVRLADSEEDCRYYQDVLQRAQTRFEQVYSTKIEQENRKQAQDVAQLTILAAIFLPLSLATGVLSMQTRVADLNLLLYDFVGVVVILGALAALLAFLTRFGKEALDIYVQFTYGRIVARESFLVNTVEAVAVGMLWLVALASFLVGMLKDIVIGLKVLGFGAAGVLCYHVATVLFVRIASIFDSR